jgi:hypothetical protein
MDQTKTILKYDFYIILINFFIQLSFFILVTKTVINSK